MHREIHTADRPPSHLTDCRSWPAATVSVDVDDKGTRYTWTTIPEHTHVSVDLLVDPNAAAAVAEAYDLDEPCPHEYRTIHAHARDHG